MARQYELQGTVDIGENRNSPLVDGERDLAFLTWQDATNNIIRLYSFDISDDTAPSIITSLEDADNGERLIRGRIDTQNQLILVRQTGVSNTANFDTRGWWLVSYDDAGSLSRLDIYSPLDDPDIDAPHGVGFGDIADIENQIFVSSRRGTSGEDTAVDVLDYSGGSITRRATFNPNGGGHRVAVDRSRQIGILSPEDAATEHHIFDVSNPDAPSVLHTEPYRANANIKYTLPDPERDLFYLIDDGNDEIVVVEFSGGTWTQRGVVTTTEGGPRFAAYDAIQTPKWLFVTGGAWAGHYDVSDPDNPTETDTQTTWPLTTRSFSTPYWRLTHDGGTRIWFWHSSGTDAGIASTSVVAGPDKPDCFVDQVGDEFADLSSSSYSHPQNAPHQDSRWQIRQATATDWSSPVYDSDWTTEDLEAHTATPIPLDRALEFRVAHRDDNGTATWSDPCPLTTTAISKLNEGPEGLFFGEQDGNRILRFGRVYTDDGIRIEAHIETNHVAPAGARGEAVFRSLYLTLEAGTDVQLVVTPIVDGDEVTAAQVSHTHKGTERKRDTLEFHLAQPVTDTDGIVFTMTGLRGSWFGVKISAIDVLGAGEKVNIESVELDADIVQEAAGALNAT